MMALCCHDRHPRWKVVCEDRKRVLHKRGANKGSDLLVSNAFMRDLFYPEETDINLS